MYAVESHGFILRYRRLQLNDKRGPRVSAKQKTLLEFAGVESSTAKLTNAKVTVIDAQNEYVNGQLPLRELAKPSINFLNCSLGRGKRVRLSFPTFIRRRRAVYSI